MKKIILLKYIICSLLALQIIGYAQSIDEVTIARVGSKTITEEEFLKRYEFNPVAKKNKRQDVESAKTDFLYTLIAEKLWALEAASIGLDTTEVMRFSKKEFEKMFVRHKLYENEILNNITVMEDELIEGNVRNGTKLQVNYLFSEDEEEIWQLYNLLNQGIPFDSILAESPEREEQYEPVEVVYGQMEEFVEDSLYNLETGKYTSPILTPDGWYIFKLTNKREQILLTEDSKKIVEKIIRARKEKQLYWKFYREFFKDKKVDVDPVLFESLANKISIVFATKKNKYQTDSDNLINLLADDVLQIEEQFGADSLKMIFVEFDENPVTLGEFFRSIAFEGFKSEKANIVSVRKLLNSAARKFIEQELLAREGYKRNLNIDPEVQAEVKMWYDNYLFQMLQNKFLDSTSVSDEEVYNYYSKRHKEESYPLMLNIIEILTDSLDNAEKIVYELEHGKDFKTLAKIYNKRRSTLKSYGEYGLQPVGNYGEIGNIAKDMKVGDIYGPVQLQEGYSIFKLIDKQEEHSVPPVPFEKVKDDYARELSYKKVKVKMDKLTVNLALKYRVEIDFNKFHSIRVTTTNSFGMRFLGFGGKITAVPMLAPNNDWVPQYLKLKEINP